MDDEAMPLPEQSRTAEDFQVEAGQVYAISDNHGKSNWLVKVISAGEDEQPATTIRYSRRFTEIPVDIDSSILTTGINEEDGSFGSIHLRIEKSDLLKNGKALLMESVSEDEYEGMEFVTALFADNNDANRDWFDEHLEKAFTMHEPLSMAILADHYLAGNGIEADSDRAAYWLNQMVELNRSMVPGQLVDTEDRVVTGGTYVFRDEKDNYTVKRVLLKDDQGVQCLNYPFQFDHLPRELNPLQLIVQASQQATDETDEFPGVMHTPVHAQMYLNGDVIFMGLLPIQPNELEGYKVYLMDMFGISDETLSPFEELKRDAEAGDRESRATMAHVYLQGHRGWGIQADYSQALHWFHLAAEDGDESAAYDLGIMYRDGEGTEVDLKEACKWLQKSADLGFAAGQREIGVFYWFGTVYPQDDSKARQWLQLAADGGDTLAANNLGDMYRDGDGTDVDIQTAQHWYEQAAREGDLGAAYSLGAMLYAEAGDSEVTREEALKWFLYAAERNSGDAQRAAGALHFQGFGCTEDYALSHAWYSMAIEHGDGLSAEAKADLRSFLEDDLEPLLTHDQIADAAGYLDMLQQRVVS